MRISSPSLDIVGEAAQGLRYSSWNMQKTYPVDQMVLYSFPTDAMTGNVSRENPIKKDDHLPDCARYLVQTLEGARDERRQEILIYEDDAVISPY